MKHLHEFIIIILAFLSICYSKEFALVAVSPLGKLAAIFLIIGYAAVDEIYGLIICAIIILYYQTDYVEHLQSDVFYEWRDIASGFGEVDRFYLEGFGDGVANAVGEMYTGFQKNMSSLATGFDYIGDDEINKNSKVGKPELNAIFSKIHEKSVSFINGAFL